MVRICQEAAVIMRVGKLTGNVWKRSVWKQMRTKRDEVRMGAGEGDDCALFSLGDGREPAISVYTVEGENMVKHAVHGAANAVAASGAEPLAVFFSMLLPETIQEACIQDMMVKLEEVCSGLHIQAAGDNIRITKAVKSPILTVTGIGAWPGADAVSVKRIKPGQDIVVSKWIGLEGTAILARERQTELLEKYPLRWMEEAKEFDRFLSIVPEAATAVKSGVCAMHGVAEGGIFGALWELAEGAGVGLDIDLGEIPIKQETIEICEFFEINPYCLLSGGSLLMIADNGYDLVRDLAREHISAAVIGKTTDSKDRVVRKEEERRFLERPKPDELYKALN